jgi:hypothetical protein
MLRFRYFISTMLLIVLQAGAVPIFACTPVTCAANTECAAMHCRCCGPNCPLCKKSKESSKNDAGCNHQCPYINVSRPVTINHVQPLVALMLGHGELHPFFFAYTSPNVFPIRRTFSVHDSSLLGLACALTT